MNLIEKIYLPLGKHLNHNPGSNEKGYWRIKDTSQKSKQASLKEILYVSSNDNGDKILRGRRECKMATQEQNKNKCFEEWSKGVATKQI